MSKPKDGGPAFPRTWTDSPQGGYWLGSEQGMSLRDWFAGQALVGWISNPTSTASPGEDIADTLARAAYGVADAMLAHRNGEGSS